MADNGLGGLEFSAGVPATIGGMVYMNFECWGKEISSFVDAVYIYDGKGCYWVKRQDYDASYRRTSFHDYYCIILAIRLNLQCL